MQLTTKPLLYIFLFGLATSSLFGQNSNKGQLRLVYLPIERVQVGGSVSVNLPTHFHFLRPFDNATRFAPDEPSSFSSLEYTFWVKDISEKILLESAVGFFRNHTKGDFLPESDEAVHFTLGNSQVGPSISIAAHYRWRVWSVGTQLQTGVGPHFSQWTSDQKAFDPKDWGIRGFGWANNMMVFIESPSWWNRLSVRAVLAYNISLSSYGDFSSTASNGIQTDYSDYNFSTRTKRPVFSISLGYDLRKNK